MSWWTGFADAHREHLSISATRSRRLLPRHWKRSPRPRGGSALPCPALLKRLYLEIGNGGFGPGYGLFGVKGGFADDVTGMTVEDLYREHQDWGDWWPTGLVPICDWGCTMGAAIDCTTPAADVVFIGDRSPLLMPQGVGFAAWMEDWGNGIDLFNPVYRRYQRFHPATPDEHS